MNKYQQAYEYVEGFIKLYPTHKLDEEHLANIKELVDLTTPLTVNYIADGYADGYPVYDTATCPNCVTIFELDYEPKYKYCPHCGQKLNWSEENE